MPPAEKLSEWAEASKASLVAYGSRENDLDFMLFTPKGVKFSPATLWADCFCGGGDGGWLCIVEDELLDISLFSGDKLEGQGLWMRADMLRNSEPPPSWICDHREMRPVIESWIQANPRKRMSDEEILNTVKWAYINLRFTEKKIPRGPLFGRFLFLHCVEPALLQLSRQYNLRAGGKGKWKGRDAETVLSPGQYSMTAFDPGLSTPKQLEACINARAALRFWLAELRIPCPTYLS
jgi:hypothetical protein